MKYEEITAIFEESSTERECYQSQQETNDDQHEF